MSDDSKGNVIDEYIKNCTEEIQPKLNTLRKVISDVNPDMTEKISWQMPTFYYNGNVIHFAANKKHIGLYPGPEVIEKYSDRLRGYKTSKGAIQIPNDKELDVKLIQDIVKYNLLKNGK